MPSAHFRPISGFRLRWLLVFGLLLLPAPAFGWIEQVVAGHETRVELEADGWVQARHQLTLSIRGGPLESLEIEGVGDDIELLSDAKVSRLKGQNATGIPLRLSMAEGGALRLEVLGGSGLRSGTYRFDFGYRLDAAKRKLLSTEDERVVFTWVGPRLFGGVDAAKVFISVPHGARPPALLQSPDRAARGVLLGQVLVGSAQDEIELLRTHVAVGEPALWQVELDRSSLARALSDDPLEPPGLAESRERLPRLGPAPWQVALGAVMVAAVGFLVFWKERAIEVLCTRTDSRARPLLPGSAWLRAALAAALAGAYVALVLVHRATFAMTAGVLLCACLVHFPPVRRGSPRGPGTWMPLDPGALARPSFPLFVRAYDSSTIPGFAATALLLLGGATLAYVRLPHDSFQALMSASFALLLLPLFLTGRLSDFPRSPAEQALSWFRFLRAAKLPTVRALEFWGRRTERAQPIGDVDEVRLRVALEKPLAGLRALEVAFEEGPGSYVSPCLVLRVVEDSPAQLRMPPGVVWSRGRQSEEKTAILHPAAPTRAQLLRLLRGVLAHQHKAAPSGEQPRPTREAGRSERSTVAGPVASPSAPASLFS